MNTETHKWLNKSRDRLNSLPVDNEDSNVYFAPDIPREKFDVLSKFSENVSYQDTLILIDDTFFGGSKDGVIMTKNIFFSHGMFEDSGKNVQASSELVIHRNSKEIFIDNNSFYAFGIVEGEEVVFLVELMQEICSWKKIRPSVKTSKLPTDCRSCGASLNSNTCDYCGRTN